MNIDWNAVALELAKNSLPGIVIGAILAYFFQRRAAHLSRVQEKRAEQIGELYALLMNVRDAMEPVLDPVLHSQEQGKGLGAAWMAFDGFFRKRQIYFDADVCKDIKALWPLVGKAVGNAKTWYKEELPGEARTKAAQTNNGAIREKIDAIVTRLERRFRKLH